MEQDLLRLKSLDDIESIKRLRVELEKLSEWHADLEKLNNQETIDIERLKTLLEKGK